MSRPGPLGAVFVIGVASLLASGCWQVDYDPASVTFDGLTYVQWTFLDVAGDALSPLGQPESFDDPGNSSRVSDRTLYAVHGVDPAEAVAIAIDPVLWGNARDAAPSHSIFLVAGRHEVPAGLCVYYDPQQRGTPVECQTPLVVVFEDISYRPWPDMGANTFQPFAFRFAPSDLTVLGVIGEVDPRLGPTVVPMVYAVAGIDPELVIVLTIDDPAADGGLQYLVFLREGAVEPPAELCAYSALPESTGCP